MFGALSNRRVFSPFSNLPFLLSQCHLQYVCVDSLELFKCDVWVSSFLKCSGDVTEGPVVRWGQSGELTNLVS